MDLISGVVVQGWWYMYRYAIPVFYGCYMRAWTIPDRGRSSHRPQHDLQPHPRHAQLLSWFSEPRRTWTMHLISGIVVQRQWYMYGYVVPLFYECYMRAWIMPNRGGSPYRPQHHPRHAQLLLRFSESRVWTIYLIIGVVIQGWWYMYHGYAIPLFYVCYMRHGPCPTGMDHPTDHNMTFNYTSNMLSCYIWRSN